MLVVVLCHRVLLEYNSIPLLKGYILAALKNSWTWCEAVICSLFNGAEVSQVSGDKPSFLR